MKHETQLALIDRVHAHQARGRGTDTAPSSLAVPTATYVDAHRFAEERALFSRVPVVVGLSGLLPERGSYAAVAVGDTPVIVARTGTGEVVAMVNMCRHRGAQLVSGCGSASLLTCPYHGWTYGIDGTAAGRRRPEHFDDLAMQDLVKVPAAEHDGVIWVCTDPDGTIGADPLHGAGDEIGPFGLADYRLFDATEFTRPLNWKIVVDTFTEAYHVGMLHRDSLAPMIHSDFALFDAFGPHGRMISVRRSIENLERTARPQWSLLPHATMLWFIVPNTVLIYQQDHAQLYQSRPGSKPGESVINVALYVPTATARSDGHWARNFELLVSVTDDEDFTTGIGMQQGFETGAMESVVFGRNEPALQHFHQAINELVSP